MIDAYNLRARSLPVYITITPVILVMAAILPRGLDLPLAGAAVVVFAPLSYLASQFGADFGKRLETKLWEKWGGPSTTRFLRHNNPEFNPVTRQQIHQKLSKFDLFIPSTDEQMRDPGLADTHWQACTEFLIRTTRDKRHHPLVFQGLVEYGFRRNLLGLKPIGLALSIASLGACGSEVWRTWGSQEVIAVPIAASLINLGILTAWLFWLRESTVSLSANRYARFLLEAASKID